MKFRPRPATLFERDSTAGAFVKTSANCFKKPLIDCF